MSAYQCTVIFSSVFLTERPRQTDPAMTEALHAMLETTTPVPAPPVAAEAGGLIPYTTYSNIVLTTGSLNAVIASFGVVANIIILRTFVGIGGILTDGVTMTLFTLALSDLGFCLSSLCWTVVATMFTIEHRFNTLDDRGFYFGVDPRALGIYFVNIMSLFGLTTTLITIHLAMMRCLCVLRPLKFRGSISPVKTALIFSTFFLLALVIRLPPVALMDIRPTFNPRTNITRPTRWYHPDREVIKDVLRTVVDIPVPVIAQVMLTVCVIVMTRALRQSRKFRNASGEDLKTTAENPSNDQRISHTSASGTPIEPSVSSDFSNISSAPIATTKAQSTSTKLNLKESRVVKQLVIISSTYIVCNLPKLVRTVGDTVEPEFKLSGRYRNLYDIASHIQFIADTLNSSVNLFIYLSFNARFRQKCCLPHCCDDRE